VVAVVIGKNYGKASDMYIKYLGFVEQERLSDYINFFDINLSLSNYESFGNTIIEAGFCGVESIVSHASGMGEVLNNTGTGYIYNDLNELILKITKIKNENEKKNKEAIRNKFLEYYGEEEIINSYQDLYNLTP
jgi:glycosyltransferase involved in cell wall biosynthesis